MAFRNRSLESKVKTFANDTAFLCFGLAISLAALLSMVCTNSRVSTLAKKRNQPNQPHQQIHSRYSSTSRESRMERRVASSQFQLPETPPAPSKTTCVVQSCVQLLSMFLIMPKWLRGRLGFAFRAQDLIVHTYTGIPVSLGPGPIPIKLPSVLMNIRINVDEEESEACAVSQPETTLRMGLLDTGAGCNMISHRAYAALGRSIRPCQASVQGLAGETELCGSIVIEWRFLPPDQRLIGSSKVYRAELFILPQSDRPLFDCILGWPWIARNLDDVQKLWIANAGDVLE